MWEIPSSDESESSIHFSTALLPGYSSGVMRQALFTQSKISTNKIQTSVCTGKQKTLDLQVPRH